MLPLKRQTPALPPRDRPNARAILSTVHPPAPILSTDAGRVGPRVRRHVLLREPNRL
jgi:hypothetical protein